MFRLAHLFGPFRRSTLALSFLLQASLIAIAAALVQGAVDFGLQPSGAISGNGSQHALQLVPMAMLAFKAGQQCVVVRSLRLNEIPTSVLPSLNCDLRNDEDLRPPYTRIGSVIVDFLVYFACF